MSEYYIPIGDGLRQQILRQDLAIEPTIEEQARAIALPEWSNEESYQVWRRPVDFGPPRFSRWFADLTKNNGWLNWNHYHLFGPGKRNIGYAKPGLIPQILGPGWSTDTGQYGDLRLPASLIDEAAEGYEHGQYIFPWNNCQDAVENIVRRARLNANRDRMIFLVPGLEPYIFR